MSLDKAEFTYRFSDVFNGQTFCRFLKQLVTRYAPRKVFLIIDNAPWHNLDRASKTWLNDNKDMIELSRLPSYSPEFMPMEGIWKQTRKLTTHNRFFAATHERDAALRKTFTKFQTHPQLISAQVARYQ